MAKAKTDNPTAKRLEIIEKEIAELSSERDELKAHWILEKELISNTEMKEEAENLKTRGTWGDLESYEIGYGK
jgi:ATP-dependent Clp protease ATP-binding subunit ClpB